MQSLCVFAAAFDWTCDLVAHPDICTRWLCLSSPLPICSLNRGCMWGMKHERDCMNWGLRGFCCSLRRMWCNCHSGSFSILFQGRCIFSSDDKSSFLNHLYAVVVFFLCLSTECLLIFVRFTQTYQKEKGIGYQSSTEEAVVKAFASSFFSFPLASLSTVSSALCPSHCFRIKSKSTNTQCAFEWRPLK